MKGIVIALAIAIAVLATMLALEPMLLPPKTVTVTATSVFTTRVPITVTTTATLRETFTTIITSPITVTRELLSTITIPTTITERITQTKTITTTKLETITTTITSIETKKVTTTKTMTTIETKTSILTKTITTTIVKNVTKTIVKSVVLQSINCGFTTGCFRNKSIANEIYSWVLRANHSIYAVLKGYVSSGGTIGEALAKAFEVLSKRGVKIVVVGEEIGAIDIPDFNASIAKIMCKYFNSAIPYDVFPNNVVVIDKKYVIFIDLLRVEILQSSELAKEIASDIEMIAQVNHAKPGYCAAWTS